MDTAVLRVPKSFYVKERDNLYDRPTDAFFRELIQNSVDAGSKNIRISMGMAPARGAFGRSTHLEEVIRVVFEDDGCGMTEDVLDNVYFRPGESTKTGGGQVGGYGRARLLTCFSQARYGIVTLDRAVEGDGPEYVHRNIPGMADECTKVADDLETGRGPDDGEEIDTRIKALRAEAARLSEQANTGAFKGCRIEIDIDPKEYGESTYRNPSLDKLSRALSSYLKLSQLPCKVWVNGEEWKERLLRGQAKKTLTALREDGEEVEFATVHLSQSKAAEFKKQVIIRVDGAAMFEEAIAADYQVVIELKPEISRDVMTSNRDGLRGIYRAAFERFRDELIANTRSALDDSKSKWVDVKGAFGVATAKPPRDEIDMKSLVEEGRAIRIEIGGSTAASELERDGFGGVPFGVLKAFLERIQYGQETFLSDWGHRELRYRLNDAISSRDGVTMVRSALDVMSAEDMALILGTLKSRLIEVEQRREEEFERRLADMHDAVIHIEGKVSSKVRDAMRRNHPDNWSVETGQGQRVRQLLAAWTTCCEVALQTLMKKQPSALREAQWRAGFVYSDPKEVWRFGETKHAYQTEAQYVKREGEEVHNILLNPVNSEGALKYNLSDPMDRQKLAVLACHEVCHIVENWHNEDFAALLTDVCASFDYRESNRRISSAVGKIREAYAKGRVRVQAMDDEPGPRPGARLMANLAPNATAMAGVLSTPQNRDVPSYLRDAYEAASTVDADGTTVIDAEGLETLEQEVTRGLNMGGAFVLEDEQQMAAAPFS